MNNKPWAYVTSAGVQTGAEPKGLQNDIAENYMKQATHQSVRFYHCQR